MLGEVAGRQLGEGEWEAEGGQGGAGLPLAPAPTTALSVKAGGGWESGPPRGGGRGTVRAQAQERPAPSWGARGLREGLTRLQERFRPRPPARTLASTSVARGVVPALSPACPRGPPGCLTHSSSRQALPPDRGSPEEVLNQANNRAFSDSRNQVPEQNTFRQP